MVTSRNKQLGNDEVRELRERFGEHSWFPFHTVAAGRSPELVHIWVGGSSLQDFDRGRE